MRFRQTVLTLLTSAGLAAATVTVALAAVPAPTPEPLQGYSISGAYVSGISSGGFMANQLHVAYSSVFQGAGIFSAGPYRCAQNFDYAVTAQNACMQNGSTRKTPAQLETETRNLATSGKVDAVSQLSGDNVYLYHGTNDNTVVQAVNDDLAAYYGRFDASVAYDKTGPAGHAWVSPLGTVACSSTASPFVNDCGDTDPVRAMLAKLTGPVNSAAASLTGKLVQFDQNAHAPGGNANAISMDAKGFAYVPTSCASGTSCELMVALHGCKQGHGYQSFGNTFMRLAYLNEYADTNNMVVLYPQAIPLSTAATTNPNGCWNWWGYGGDADYAWHGGDQIEAIMNMVETLTGGATPTTPPTTPPTSPTPTPTATCVTSSNYTHTTAGRARATGGYTYANGSNQNLGLWNTFTTSTIKQTGTDYWIKC